MSAAMRLEATAEGFAIAAGDLAALLGLAPEEVRRLMQAGRITSRFERGEGEDAGRFRVSFFHGARWVRLTVDAEGRVLHRTRVDAAPPPEGRR
jgi:hypothetical protein